MGRRPESEIETAAEKYQVFCSDRQNCAVGQSCLNLRTGETKIQGEIF